MKQKLKDLKNNQCRNCSIVKLLCDFKHNRRVCKLCESEKAKTRYYNNQEKEIARTVLWNKKNPEKHKANRDAYEKRHFIQRRSKFLDWVSNQSKEERTRIRIFWQQQNPDKCQILNSKYKISKLQRIPNWLNEKDWEVIRDFYNKAYKLTQLTGIKYEVDHIIPLRGKNVSGLHVPNNLQIITKSKNAKKSNKYEI